MDYDSDGNLDMIFGTYVDGDLLIALGTEELGRFRAPTVLWSMSEDLEVSNDYLTPILRDMDDDGDLDMTIGAGNGMAYVENTGSESKAEFVSDPRPITFDGEVPSPKMFSPGYTDWDGDGNLDLLFGCSSGAVYLCRGAEDSGRTLKYGRPEILITHSPLLESPSHHYSGAVERNGKIHQPRSAACSRIAIADWNGDGHEDLLVGEKYSVRFPDLPKTKVTVRNAKGEQEVIELEANASCGGIWLYERKPGAIAMRAEGAAAVAEEEQEDDANMAPAFSLSDQDGKEHSLTDYRGRYVILDWWGIW